MIVVALTSAILLSPVPVSKAEESLSVEEVYGIICQLQYLWDCNEMVRRSHRESGYTPTATNYDCYPNHINPATLKPYICVGLLQVMEIHVPNWIHLRDPYYNVEVSYRLWLESGYYPWLASE